MTDKGSFIINGAERVVVSQLHRSPGVFFGQSVHANGTKLYSARIIPFKGSWIEFATDINSVMYAYIDRKMELQGTHPQPLQCHPPPPPTPPQLNDRRGCIRQIAHGPPSPTTRPATRTVCYKRAPYQWRPTRPLNEQSGVAFHQQQLSARLGLIHLK